ncbi:MAG: aminomethyltransferase family protein [Pyrinomonadaceae bacterium]|nr:aminomethyltransferase family protein [Pyrinomonadaceae bacterium]
MTEAVEQITLSKSPLDEVHRHLGAVLSELCGWSVPWSYGDELFEYAAVREAGVGLIDLSSRGRFQVSGSEAVQFLNGLITNDMKTLTENRWMPAAFPNVQGRLIASVRVIRKLDDATGKKPVPVFLIDTEPTTREAVLKTIERFTLAGDFHVVDVTNQTALLSLQGKRAADMIGSVIGESAHGIPAYGAAQIEWQQQSLTVLRATHTAEDGFDILVSADQATSLWDVLVNAGARPIGHEAWDRLRIEAGVPRYGIDMDETNVVTETGLDEAVSYTKGCYIGQEIIARIKYRGHVAKKLVGLVFDRARKIDKDVKIRSVDDKEIGRITSHTLSPHLGSTIALGYVKYDYLAPDTEVRVTSSQGDLPARVAELPLVRGTASIRHQEQ